MGDQEGSHGTVPVNPSGNVKSPEEIHAARNTLDQGLRASWQELAHVRKTEAEEIRALNEQIEAIRASATERISKLEHEIVQMKTQRNAMADVFRLLPMEILLKILMACDSYNDSHKGLTQSCRHWRDATLDCPEMWSTILKPFHFKSHLQRSRSAPLSVLLDLTSLNLEAGRGLFICNALREHTHRIRNLHLELRMSQFRDVLTALTSRSAPILEDLCISDLGLHYLLEREDEFEHIQDEPWPYPLTALPAFFLNDHAPKLHRLKLHGCVPSWYLDIFSNLTELEVDAFLEHPSIPIPSAQHFLGALARMPRLVKLKLQIPLPKMSHSRYPNISPISFPLLQCLELESSVVGCTGFMEHVRLPATSLVHVYPGRTSNHPNDPSNTEILAFGASLYEAWISAPLDPNPAELPGLVLKVSDESLALSRIPPGAPSHRRIAPLERTSELVIDKSSSYMRMALTHTYFDLLISALSLGPTLYKLKYKGELPDPSCWSTVLQGLSALTYLHLNGKGAAQFLTWASDNVLDQALEGQARTVTLEHLSQIETLSFRQLNFFSRAEAASWQGLKYHAPRPELRRFVARLLQARRARTATLPLLTLKFNSCVGLTYLDYEEMKNSGVDVILKDSELERELRRATGGF